PARKAGAILTECGENDAVPAPIRAAGGRNGSSRSGTSIAACSEAAARHEGGGKETAVLRTYLLRIPLVVLASIAAFLAIEAQQDYRGAPPPPPDYRQQQDYRGP